MNCGKNGVFGNFNSHAHVERDFKIIRRVPSFFISTHTLTWSVTAIIYAVQKDYKNFNSHAHVERDPFFCPMI